MRLSRRIFLTGCTAMVVSACQRSSIVSTEPKKLLAITMDDFNLGFEHGMNLVDRNAAILAAFAHYNHKAAGFVTGKFVRAYDSGQSVVQSWNDAGHVIGNHTYSHMNSTKKDAALVKADILKNHAYLSNFSGYNNTFRFPYLAEGGTKEKVSEYRVFLDEHGLANAPVTIDTIDWFVSSRLEKRLKHDPQYDVSGYRDYYVKSVLELAEQKHQLALRLGYVNLPHTVLVHHNILNGMFIRDVMDALVGAGWFFVDADKALSHPFYDYRPETPNRGRSVLSVLAQENDIEHRFPDSYRGFGKDTMDTLGL